ncbi:hypothetical protein [Geobacter pickeringii]|uniref:hypothetical protein n=1 Tax=Geobacter pickeringii TaxID=345632 RepID=UPI000AFFEF31|nr:hypothetical protein [Geobacter pickeringii]
MDELLGSIRSAGGEAELGVGTGADPVLEELWQRIEGGVAGAVAGVSFRELAARENASRDTGERG